MQHKHALLAQLVAELKLPLKLVVGIFEMSEAKNTPGVGRVLQGYGLDAIPEAHCYLSDGRHRIDATSTASLMSPVPRVFLHEEVTGPEQVGVYKKTVHQAFLADWLARKRLGDDWTIERLWRVREECIAALSDDSAKHPAPH